MVNTGIVRSDAGHGIWAELGAIVNLTNRGLILGGVASVRALQTSSILNESAGTLDGRILLEGAGSSLVNEGIVRFRRRAPSPTRSTAVSPRASEPRLPCVAATG